MNLTPRLPERNSCLCPAAAFLRNCAFGKAVVIDKFEEPPIVSITFTLLARDGEGSNNRFERSRGSRLRW